MAVRTTYRQILSLSVPIMLGSAAQNLIAVTDSLFLYHLSAEDFAAIGFVSVFYLIIAAIGYGFSRGGQILIARKFGAGLHERAGHVFQVMIVFEAVMALILFAVMQFGMEWFFSYFINSEVILKKSVEYIHMRSWGVFFSYVGVGIVALYSGLARTTFIMVDTLILAAVNIFLNYSLIFGHFGLPAMGITGAGLASTIAEIVAFVIFLVYMTLDGHLKTMSLFTGISFDWSVIRSIWNISSPILAQVVLGLGSWFLFFSIIENIGERALAKSNLVRIVYLAVSVPSWGYSSGINTLVSNYIGNRKRMAVRPVIYKTALLSLGSTLLITLPVILFPTYLLYPILGSQDMSLIVEAKPIFYILLGIVSAFSISTIYFNGLIGTGATFFGLKIQGFLTIAYIAVVYYIVEMTTGGLLMAWSVEIFYWILIGLVSNLYLRSNKWYELKI